MHVTHACASPARAVVYAYMHACLHACMYLSMVACTHALMIACAWFDARIYAFMFVMPRVYRNVCGYICEWCVRLCVDACVYLRCMYEGSNFMYVVNDVRAHVHVMRYLTCNAIQPCMHACIYVCHACTCALMSVYVNVVMYAFECVRAFL